MLNQITYQTALATKAARCRIAAGDRAALVDFSLRRTHGIEAGVAAARAAAIAGFVGTSNVAAARRLGITAVGTMAHSYIQVFEHERDAFTAFAEDHPDRTTFLVDTYDTMQGVATALEVAAAIPRLGRVAIRLDSGDLLDLARRARRLMDTAGRPDIAIIASGGLDEFDVRSLLDAGAPIDVFAVGTRVGLSADAPTLDTAYKLVEYADRPVMKLSQGKATRPGPKQVLRATGPIDDVLATRGEQVPVGRAPLLVPVMRAGRRLGPTEPLSVLRDRLADDLADLRPEARDLHAGPVSATPVSPRLDALTRHVREERLERRPPPRGCRRLAPRCQSSTSSTPAARSSSSARCVVSAATPATIGSSTRTANPAASASSAVARTQ